jgi:hypothetical protein
MKDVFYGIVSALLILIMWAGIKYDKQLEQPKYNGAVVVEKSDDFIYGLIMYMKYENDSIISERVYQIFYDKYSVGDTINCP